MKLFISHSARDSAIVERLIALFRSALNLRAHDIRCTSVDGYRLPWGTKTDRVLRKDIEGAQVLVAVISDASVNSMYVLFELGACWGLQKPLLPLLAPGVSAELLSGPLQNMNALRMDSSAQLHQVVQELASRLNVSSENAAVYQRDVEALLALGVQNDAMEAPQPGAHQERLKRFFLVGCSIGNGWTVLPFSSDNVGRLTMFLEQLNALALADNEACKRLSELKETRKSAEMSREVMDRYLHEFFRALGSLGEIVEAACTETERTWYLMGKLIHELACRVPFNEPIEPDEVGSRAIALDAIAEREGIPSPIRTAVTALSETARNRPDPKVLWDQCVELSEAIEMAL